MNEIRIMQLSFYTAERYREKQHYIRKPLAGEKVDRGSQFEQHSIYIVLRMIA